MSLATPRIAALLVLALAAAPRAAAEEHAISQRDKTFAPSEITVKQGDMVTFLNDDEVSHNVFSRSEGDRFNLKFQKPGEHKSHVFQEPGTKVIRCAIHPKMKLVVEVEPAEPQAEAQAPGDADPVAAAAAPDEADAVAGMDAPPAAPAAPEQQP